MSIFKKKPMSEDKPSPSKDLSVAFEIQSRNKRKKMSNGGEVAPALKEDEAHLPESTKITEPFQQPKSLYDETEQKSTSREPDESKPNTSESKQEMLDRHASELAAHESSGGDYDTDQLLLGDDDGIEESHPKSVAEAIMHRKKMADGGVVAPSSVDITSSTREMTDPKINTGSFDADLKESYDKDDMVSKIMKKKKQ
jgi:hypothetical protein